MRTNLFEAEIVTHLDISYTEQDGRFENERSLDLLGHISSL
ncbi:uncharacterized protein METZ01_LOCUS391948 [marine metagenome]|uniref:Uncharacterized protein n=1 Tax=marine metagenome TaxID=408172 RepID=A0A382UXY0_9ZZZZ